MRLKTLLAATALCAVMVAPAAAQTAPKMADVLKAWKIDRPTETTKFVTRSVSESQVVLENLTTKETDGSSSSFAQVLITRQVGGAGDQFDVQMQNGRTTDKNGLTSRFGTIDLVGLSMDESFLLAAVSGTRQPEGNFNLGLDIRMQDVVIEEKDSKGTPSTYRFGSFNLQGLELSEQRWFARDLQARDVQVGDADISITVKSLGMSELSYQDPTGVLKKLFGSPEDFAFSGLTMKRLALEDVKLVETQSEKTAETGPVNFSMGRFEIDDWQKDRMGRFGFSNLLLQVPVQGQNVDFGIESFALSDINLAYWSAIFKALGEKEATSAAQKAPKAKSGAAARNQPASAPASQANAQPSPRLKDLLPGGPFDAGIGGFNMANLLIGYNGFKFTIDKVSGTSTKDANGFITRSTLEPMTMKLVVPEVLLQQSAGPMAGLAPLLADGIELVFRFDGSYDPATDVAKFDNFEYWLKGWGKINAELALDGLSNYYRNNTVADVVKPLKRSLAAAESAGSSKDQKKKPDEAQQIRDLLALYRGVRFVSGRVGFEDLGGLDKAAGLFVTMTEPDKKGSNSRAGASDAQAIAAVRKTWADPMRASSTQKDRSAFDRQFSSALANWLELGGRVIMSSAPATPVDGQALQSAKDPVSLLGLSVTHQPPAKK